VNRQAFGEAEAALDEFDFGIGRNQRIERRIEPHDDLVVCGLAVAMEHASKLAIAAIARAASSLLKLLPLTKPTPARCA
jgi:hypothetical protein